MTPDELPDKASNFDSGKQCCATCARMMTHQGVVLSFADAESVLGMGVLPFTLTGDSMSMPP